MGTPAGIPGRKASDRKKAGGRSHPGSGRDPEDSQEDPGVPEETHREQRSGS